MFKSVAVDRKVPLSRRKREVVSELDASSWLRTVERGNEPFFSVAPANVAGHLLSLAQVGYTPIIAATAFLGTMFTEGAVWAIIRARAGVPFGDVIDIIHPTAGAFFTVFLSSLLVGALVGLVGIPADLYNKKSWASLKELQLNGLRGWLESTHEVTLPDQHADLDVLAAHTLAGNREDEWDAMFEDTNGRSWELKPADMKADTTTWSAVESVAIPSAVKGFFRFATKYL